MHRRRRQARAARISACRCADGMLSPYPRLPEPSDRPFRDAFLRSATRLVIVGTLPVPVKTTRSSESRSVVWQMLIGLVLVFRRDIGAVWRAVMLGQRELRRSRQDGNCGPRASVTMRLSTSSRPAALGQFAAFLIGLTALPLKHTPAPQSPGAPSKTPHSPPPRSPAPRSAAPSHPGGSATAGCTAHPGTCSPG